MDAEIKKYIDQEVKRQVEDTQRFMYNSKYRFDFPVELSKSVTVGTSQFISQTAYIRLDNLPTSATGLDTGQLWNNAGVVNIKT